MQCRIEALEDCTVIAPAGRIDNSTVASLMETILETVRASAVPVVIDMQGVPFMSSAGLRVLMIVQRELRRRDQRLTVRSAQPAVDELLRVAGLDTLLEVRP